MKTFKTRSSAMRRAFSESADIESVDNYGSFNFSINLISPPPYLLLNINKIDKCIEDDLDICLGTASVAYLDFDFDNPFDVDIFFSKSSFTSNDLGKIGNYNNITAINVLNEVKYSVTYKETITNNIVSSNTTGLPSEDDMYIKYTINEKNDTVLNKLDKIRETNKQVLVNKNNTSQDRREYLIFTDKGKVQISDK